MTAAVLRAHAAHLPLPDSRVERARALQVPKPPPIPDGQEALFAL